MGVPTVTGPHGVVSGARLGGRRAQVLLAALALERGPLSGDRLADLVWDGRPPATWPAALRGVVRGLRQAVAAAGVGDQELVATVSGGYQLGAGVDVDVAEAETALHEARALVAGGRYRAAVDRLRPATGWRGSELMPGAGAAWLDAHRAKVDELARSAWELTAEAASGAGDRTGAVAAARRLVELTPLDERAHRSVITALDAAGDRAGAVQAFEACRRILADELGVDPAPQTVEAYLHALGEPSPSRPAHVPRVGSTFRGRATEAAALAELVAGPGLVTLTGPGGVGKSRVAAEVAARQDGLAGGVWWVPLESVGQDALVAATVALTMGLDPGDDPSAAVVAALSPHGRALLVLDGAEAALDGVASLAAELARRCPALTVLATSRVRLGVDGEQLLTLKPWSLPAEEATTVQHPLVGLLLDRLAERGGRLTDEQATGPLVRSLLDQIGRAHV